MNACHWDPVIPLSPGMTKNLPEGLAGKAAIAAGAIGSAAIAAALLYANRRKDKATPPATGTAPHHPPETD